MSPLAVLGGELGLGYLLNPLAEPVQDLMMMGSITLAEPAGTHLLPVPAL